MNALVDVIPFILVLFMFVSCIPHIQRNKASVVCYFDQQAVTECKGNLQADLDVQTTASLLLSMRNVTDVLNQRQLRGKSTSQRQGCVLCFCTIYVYLCKIFLIFSTTKWIFFAENDTWFCLMACHAMTNSELDQNIPTVFVSWYCLQPL